MFKLKQRQTSSPFQPVYKIRCATETDSQFVLERHIESGLGRSGHSRVALESGLALSNCHTQRGHHVNLVFDGHKRNATLRCVQRRNKQMPTFFLSTLCVAFFSSPSAFLSPITNIRVESAMSYSSSSLALHFTRRYDRNACKSLSVRYGPAPAVTTGTNRVTYDEPKTGEPARQEFQSPQRAELQTGHDDRMHKLQQQTWNAFFQRQHASSQVGGQMFNGSVQIGREGQP